MQMELRACKLCYDGEHGNPEKTAQIRDMVECVRTIREYKDLLGIDSVYLNFVDEADEGGAEALPAIAASVEGNQIHLNDTQLVVEDQNGIMILYPDPADILEVLTRNVDQLDAETRQDLSVELSEESRELLSS